jgi:Na+/H+ antiporter NhaD/arsenite permease-like protein
VRTALVGAGLLVVGVLGVAFGVVGVADVAALFDRVWPVLLFVIAIAVVAELAADAELFRVLADGAARVARGRAVILWLLVVALAAASTVFLSLDTTAVLLTPIVVVMARRAKLDPLPFALTTVWLANTASLLLPVSNLTNLLALHSLGGIHPTEFASATWVAAAAAVLVPVLMLFVMFRRRVTGRFEVPRSAPVPDRVALIASAIVLAALLPLLVSGLPVWLPASVAALLLIAVFAVRRPAILRPNLIPWPPLIFAAGLFLVMDELQALGVAALVQTAAGSGGSLPELLRTSGVSALTANVVGNLPAYLALQPPGSSIVHTIAILIGVNAGSVITPWASLATMLWHARLQRAGIRISWRRFALWGCILAPLTVAAATLALWLSHA